MPLYQPTEMSQKVQELASRFLEEKEGDFPARNQIKRLLKLAMPDPYNPAMYAMPIGMARPASGIFKKKILSDLATTPERQTLWKEVVTTLTDFLLNKKTSPKEAYLFGSYPTPKPSPSDIDIFAMYPEGSRKIRAATERLATAPDKLNITIGEINPFDTTEYELRKEGIKRYGDKAAWIRILGLLGALGIGSQAERK
jgi:hypothetical protein